MEDTNFIKIDNQYIKGDKILTSQELTILTLLCRNRTVKNQFTFTIKWIIHKLGLKDTTKNITTIRNTLNILQRDNILKYYSDTEESPSNEINILHLDKTDFTYASIEEETDNFTMLYDNELTKIIEYSNTHKVDVYNIINFYIYVLSFINTNSKDENYKLCYVSMDNINNELGLSENTIIKYINILKDINLLRCDYAGYKENAKGQVKNSTMYYCRACDEELLIERLNKIRDDQGFIKLNSRNKDKSNIKKSIKQKINYLNKRKENNNITKIELITLEKLKEEYNKLTTSKKEKKE